MMVGTGYPADRPGSLQGRLFRSADHGQSWIEVASGLQTSAIRQVVYSSSDTLHAATWGFLSSTDQGKTWTTNNLGYSGRAFSTSGCLALLDSPSVCLFYGTDEGVFRSYDEGLTWHFSSMGLDRPLVTLLKSDRNGNLYCGIMRYLGTPAGGYGDGRLMRSSDRGQSWSPVQISKDWRYLDMDEAPNGDLYCAHGFGAQLPSATIVGSSLAVSQDQGLTWKDLPVMSGMGFCTTTTPNGDLFVAGESAGTWRSVDQGSTWTLLPVANQTSNLTLLTSTDQGDLILSGGAMRGLFFSSAVENGIPWHTYDNPDLPDYYSLSDVAFDADGNAWCTTRGQNGVPALFFLEAPIQSSSPLQPVDGIFGPLFDMVWDACGYLYIYSTGAVLKSKTSLRSPSEPCTPVSTLSPYLSPSSIWLYPNPASHTVTIQFQSMTGHGFIRLINAQGIMIQDILVRIQEGENRFQLSLDGLPSGIYQVQLSCPDGIFSSTLIVQAG
ncbi:MAG TPA: T9SS type A sorting domain-containing protein [Saprospiraceae bacterium]|nr:T9SS type A sorting domain-containing protein [Saprospiraceae bacterium]